jgi:ubiquinone/menaquinone biosynthesis C-methylase UbiE
MTGTLIDEFKGRQRAVWASGDYPSIAERIQVAADALVADAEITDGTTVLDIATGSGNVAIPAAQSGGAVTGLDLVPELLEAAARRAEAAGVTVEWVEGDAEALPFGDDSFDRVLSTFGVMFAPRHEAAAAEMVRVCRPGGLIGVCSWTLEGAVGAMFRLVSSYMPPPPDFVQPPPLWGDEDHVRRLLGESCDLELERRVVLFEDESVEAYMQWFAPRFGPLVAARPVLGEERFAELHDDLVALMRERSEADDAYRSNAEYLRVIARPR